jgi:hypothetical protein
MNIFKDQQGREWICTPLMAKKLGIHAATLYNHKSQGNLKRGLHWVQQTTGHRRIYFNEQSVKEWWRKASDIKQNSSENFPYSCAARSVLQKNKPEKFAEPIRTAQEQRTSLHIYLSDEAKQTVEKFAEQHEVIVEEKLAGEVIARMSRVPSLSSVVNMLVLRAIADINAESAA